MRHLIFVIMGESFEVAWEDNGTLFMLRWYVLQETYNTGRPAEDFVIRDDQGNTLNPWTRVRDLPPGKLYLSVQVGWGGSHHNFRRKDEDDNEAFWKTLGTGVPYKRSDR